MTQDEIIEMARQAELESQEPVAWLLTEKNINSLQVDSIQLLINRLKHAHHTDLCVRINGQDEWFQADWLKHMVRATPPQRTEQEPFAWMDEDGNVSDNNDHGCFSIPLYTNPLQRTWIGLTDKEMMDAIYVDDTPMERGRRVETKLKDKNCVG